MLKGKYTTIELVRGSKEEYVVKDSVGITIGRVYIIELIKENRFCSCRIRFYKQRKESYDLLKDVLKTLLISIFRNMNVYKIIIFAGENINIISFTDLGFELEGVITNSSIIKERFHNELMFGIDVDSFESGQKERNIILSGKRLDLKVLTPENAEEVLEYYLKNKEHLKEFEPTREESFYTLEAQRHILIEGYKQFLNGQSINFGVYKKDSLIGKVQISNIVMGVFRNAFVGYSIDKDYQGQGYMKEALNLVIDYTLKELNLHRIEASTLISNRRSQGVLKGCGFIEAGVNEKYLFINGQWRDHILFYKILD